MLALAAGAELDLAGTRLAARRLQTLVDQGLGDRDCILIAKLSVPDQELDGFHPASDARHR